MVSPEDNLKYARLLYRAGLWLSQVEDTGGRDAEIQERDGIRRTLRAFSRERDYTSIVSIIENVLSHQSSWKLWSRDIGDFTAELRAEKSAMPLALRQCVYELSHDVALRYRERNFVSAAIKGVTGSFMKYLVPGSRPVSSVNISSVEKHALNEMADILGLTHQMMD